MILVEVHLKGSDDHAQHVGAIITESTQTLVPVTTMPDLQTSLALHTIRLAYKELGSRVNRAIHTQVGDEARLNEQAGDAHRLMAALELVRRQFSLMFFIHH